MLVYVGHEGSMLVYVGHGGSISFKDSKLRSDCSLEVDKESGHGGSKKVMDSPLGSWKVYDSYGESMNVIEGHSGSMRNLEVPRHPSKFQLSSDWVHGGPGV